MKCKYSHCKHKTKEIPKGEEILVGKSSYYHQDCYEEIETIKNIIDTYVKKVDSHPIMSLLRKVINEIIYKHNVDANFLLFALNYCIDQGWNIRYPQGLYYVVKNKEANQKWKQMISSEYKSRIKKMKNDMKDINEEENTFEYRMQKAVGFDDILR